MPVELTARAPGKGDFPRILSLYRVGIVPTWDQVGRDYDFEVIEKNLERNLYNPLYHFRVYETHEGALVGYLAWDQYPDHTSKNVVAHLSMLLVNPDFQRGGVARRMVQYFELHARKEGCTKVLFDVVVGSPALAFYTALGYTHWSNYMERRL